MRCGGCCSFAGSPFGRFLPRQQEAEVGAVSQQGELPGFGEKPPEIPPNVVLGEK
jgi:hypothetical protein